MGHDLKGNDIGKWFTQDKDGRYKGRFTNHLGKTVTIRGRTLEEIKDRLYKEVKKDNLLSLNEVPEYIFDEWYEKWMRTYGRKLADSTRRLYFHYYEEVKGQLGKKEMHNIKGFHIQQVLNEMTSDSKRERIRSMLHGVFQKAYLEEVIKYNPVHNTEWHLEKTEKRKREALDKNQERILIELLRYNVNRFDRGSCINLIELILHTGLRISEVIGLTWSNVDFEKNIINVDQTLLSSVGMDIDGNKYGRTTRFSAPKTERSCRRIPMINRTRELLLEEKGRIRSHELRKRDDEFKDLVFVNLNNMPICDDTIRRMLRSFTKELQEKYDDFPNVSPHILRHTFATS